MSSIPGIETVTMPHIASATARRVSDMVRDMIPKFRQSLSREETQLGIYLRGNKELFQSLCKIIQFRIEGRANLPLPEKPIECMERIARDKELRWFLSRLEFVYRSPVVQGPESQGEPPA